MSQQLADLLVKDKIITPAQHAEAVAANKEGKGHIQFLIEKKYVSENKLILYLSQKFGLPSVNIAKFDIPADVIKLIPVELARKHRVIPLQSNKGTIVVAVWDPTSIPSLESLKFIIKQNVEAVLTTYTAFDTAMSKYYGGAAVLGAAIDSYKKETPKSIDGGGSGSGLELSQVHELDTSSSEQEAPVIQLVNGVLAEAIRRGASDIHVEPYERRFRVRMRIDGTLLEIAQVPMEMRRAVIARFKVMSRMDIAENRVPQDGRIKLKANGTEIDFRVNSMPTLFGEKVVLRLLNKGNLQLDLLKLGFEPKQLDNFRRGINAPNGMVLVTGPTGSGKTTTLYSALAELNKVSDNLSTAEDPVEYNLEGINQVQVQKEVGLTFAGVLRALLRQDPDVILVGEIRDYETAEVAVQAALTGHLVLSTLHTNDAASTITRLLNMGLEPFMVVASLNTIVAQRLLRSVCAKCKVEVKIPREELMLLGATAEELDKAKFFKGPGCANCNNTGYKGRVAIYEVLELSQNLKEMVLHGDTVIDIKKQAIKEGMKTLRKAALTKVFEGQTTLEEAVSLTMEN